MRRFLPQIQPLRPKTDRLAPFLRLFLGTGLALLLAGCVLGPLEFEEEETLYAPEIDLDQLYPPQLGIITVRREDCARITFEASRGGVSDLNKDDVLYVWWILDWDPSKEDISDQTVVKESFIGKMADAVRSGPQLDYTLSLSQPDTFFDKTHTLTLIVRDRTPEDEDGLEDQVQWTFEVVDGGTYCDEQ